MCFEIAKRMLFKPLFNLWYLWLWLSYENAVIEATTYN